VDADADGSVPTKALEVLVGGTPVDGTVTAWGEVWFFFTAEESTNYTIQTIAGTLDDTVIELVGADAVTTLDSNDDDPRFTDHDPPVKSSYMVVTAAVMGLEEAGSNKIRFVKVKGFGSSAGTFKLAVAVNEEAVNEEESLCTPNPCLNRGTCAVITNDGGQSVQCSCADGFSGQLCGDAPNCVNNYDIQNWNTAAAQSENGCENLISSGWSCEVQFASGGDYAGYCDKSCNTCEGTAQVPEATMETPELGPGPAKWTSTECPVINGVDSSPCAVQIYRGGSEAAMGGEGWYIGNYQGRHDNIPDDELVMEQVEAPAPSPILSVIEDRIYPSSLSRPCIGAAASQDACRLAAPNVPNIGTWTDAVRATPVNVLPNSAPGSLVYQVASPGSWLIAEYGAGARQKAGIPSPLTRDGAIVTEVPWTQLDMNQALISGR